jgi:hypothetical protein
VGPTIFLFFFPFFSFSPVAPPRLLPAPPRAAGDPPPPTAAANPPPANESGRVSECVRLGSHRRLAGRRESPHPRRISPAGADGPSRVLPILLRE